MPYRLLHIFIILLSFATAKQEKPKPAKKVEAITIKRSDLQRTTKLLGRVEANRQAFIKSEASGMVDKIHVSPGQQVEKGQLLLSIENQREKDRLEYATKSKTLAQNQVDRLEKLATTGRASLRELEEAKRMVLEADKQQSAAEDDLAHREVRAPFAGQIGIFNYTEGGSVATGDKITSLADLSDTFVVFDVAESIISLIELGGQVEVNVGDQFVRGEIIVIDPIVNPETGMTKVKARISLPNHKPGRSIYVHVALEKHSNVIVIPETAIFMRRGMVQVVVVKDGKAEYVPVKMGLKQRNHIEIAEGLTAGDVVVAVNPRRIYPGDKLEVVKSDKGSKA